MTYPPVPPGQGSYPPPVGYSPPAPGYYPFPAGHFPPPGHHPAALPTSAYTSWVTRVAASLIDGAIYAVIVAAGLFPFAFTGTRTCSRESTGATVSAACEVTPSTLGSALFAIAMLAALAFLVWNYGYRQGTTGSSVGKSVMKFKVIGEANRRPIGFGPSVVRQFAHLIDGLTCYIGYLFPLWDAKRQTIADKIMSTVCISE